MGRIEVPTLPPAARQTAPATPSQVGVTHRARNRHSTKLGRPSPETTFTLTHNKAHVNRLIFVFLQEDEFILIQVPNSTARRGGSKSRAPATPATVVPRAAHQRLGSNIRKAWPGGKDRRRLQVFGECKQVALVVMILLRYHLQRRSLAPTRKGLASGKTDFLRQVIAAASTITRIS